MKKNATRVWVECFYYPTEDKDKVKKALATVAGDADTKETDYESYYGPTFTLIQVDTGNQADIRKVLENIILTLKQEDLKEVQETLEERVDDDGVLHLRFEKQDAYEGILTPGVTGDAIKVRIKLAAYPATRENLIASAKELLS